MIYEKRTLYSTTIYSIYYLDARPRVSTSDGRPEVLVVGRGFRDCAVHLAYLFQQMALMGLHKANALVWINRQSIRILSPFHVDVRIDAFFGIVFVVATFVNGLKRDPTVKHQISYVAVDYFVKASLFGIIDGELERAGPHSGDDNLAFQGVAIVVGGIGIVSGTVGCGHILLCSRTHERKIDRFYENAPCDYMCMSAFRKKYFKNINVVIQV